MNIWREGNITHFWNTRADLLIKTCPCTIYSTEHMSRCAAEPVWFKSLQPQITCILLLLIALFVYNQHLHLPISEHPRLKVHLAILAVILHPAQTCGWSRAKALHNLQFPIVSRGALCFPELSSKCLWHFKVFDLCSNRECICPLWVTGKSQRHCSGCWSELRLCLQQCDPAFGRGWWGVCAAGRRKGPRREHKQIQHFLRLPHLPRLRKRTPDTCAYTHTHMCKWCTYADTLIVCACNR